MKVTKWTVYQQCIRCKYLKGVINNKIVCLHGGEHEIEHRDYCAAQDVNKG